MTIREELEKIAANHPEGLLAPRDVVEFARNTKTALHKEFEWDDSVAADIHRLDTARRVIRLQVSVIESVPKPVRAWVSLPRDRHGREDGGGYRDMIDVMSHEDLREELLAECRADMAQEEVAL